MRKRDAISLAVWQEFTDERYKELQERVKILENKVNNLLFQNIDDEISATQKQGDS